MSVSDFAAKHAATTFSADTLSLFEQNHRAQQALAQSERLLAAEAAAWAELTEWSSRLWQYQSLNQGLAEVLTGVMAVVGADKGSVQIRNGESLPIVAQRGLQPDFLDSIREICADEQSTCAKALRILGRRVVIEDVESDPLFEPLRALARAADFRSLLSTPLLDAGGALFGTVFTCFRAIHRPTDAELRRLDLYLRVARDFVQRCKMEQALQQSEDALREANRRKDEFLALLAHELRNPLAAIRYALATTQKPGHTLEQQQRAEQIIERQVGHMSRLLDDLLDVSRITRGALELKESDTELTSVLGAAIEAARPMMDAKHHTLSLELPKQAVRLSADAVRLSQVFSNLLINAAKYTDPDGQIKLRATQEGREVVVTVRDNGIGIPAEMMPRLFTLFSQANAAGLARSEGGLGIGLSLVRGLVALHGGRVEARSDGAGQGSEFIVRLPVAPGPERSEPDGKAANPSAGSRLKILVVDDNRDAADTCAMLLELSGQVVRTAYTGRAALKLAEIFRPDVLLLDIGLPDVNGYELARELRAASWGQGSIIIAVTGWGQEDDKRRALEAGFDRHLTKPIAAEALESLLQSLSATLRPQQAGRFTQKPSPEAPAAE